MESAALFGADGEAALRVAAALECVHCYSLIHDDLPAMDDDDLRRGQPTVHKAFDEATAILAGDSLLTFAFDILADEATALAADSAQRRWCSALARAAGAGGMAGGQALDLEAERDAPDEAGIIRLQAMKTGALIRFACEAGAIVAGARAGRPRAAGRIRLGDRPCLPACRRPARPDRRRRRRWARRPARTRPPARRRWSRCMAPTGRGGSLPAWSAQAHALLEPYGERAAMLKAAASFIAERRS